MFACASLSLSLPPSLPPSLSPSLSLSLWAVCACLPMSCRVPMVSHESRYPKTGALNVCHSVHVKPSWCSRFPSPFHHSCLPVDAPVLSSLVMHSTLLAPPIRKVHRSALIVETDPDGWNLGCFGLPGRAAPSRLLPCPRLGGPQRMRYAQSLGWSRSHRSRSCPVTGRGMGKLGPASADGGGGGITLPASRETPHRSPGLTRHLRWARPLLLWFALGSKRQGLGGKPSPPKYEPAR